jgi:coatomer protein complex subunit alpha (xenin)
VKELIQIAREYVLGLKMEVKRKELKEDPIRQQELAAYFTNCNLQKVHTRLVLTSAMGLCFKGGNYATAAYFARLLLQTNPNEAQAKKARQVVQACGDRKDARQLNYDFRNPFVVCGSTFVPIYQGQNGVSCPYCGSRFVPSVKGELCSICELSVVGADASGLFCSPTQSR